MARYKKTADNDLAFCSLTPSRAKWQISPATEKQWAHMGEIIDNADKANISIVFCWGADGTKTVKARRR